jgi:subtilisin family serine protease
MKRSIFFSVIVTIALILGGLTLIANPGVAQTGSNPSNERQPNSSASAPVSESSLVEAPNAVWTIAPASPFGLTRFDGVFVPGGDDWANKVYFLGGRSGSSTEDPNIWQFNPVTGTYIDTGADVVEDVSNYTANLVMDDGTGRGPAIYMIGGYDADNAAANIGTVQRYYPQVNLAEALPSADDWNVLVAGELVTAMGNAVVGNVIYVFGGWENITAPYFYGGTWVFNPTQPSGSRWTDLGLGLTPARSYIQVAVQNNIIYAMGGIDQYVGGDLVPTTIVEALDTDNIGPGWTALPDMPVASAEGRGFGFDADTLGINQSWAGKVYVVGGGDWNSRSAEVMEYNIDLNLWDQGFPDLNQARRDHAGVFVPLCTADPNDGLPGMWVFGGNISSDAGPYGDPEYYPLECPATCNVLVVDDDWDFDSVVPNDGGRPYYTSTLDTLGYPYTVWDTVSQGDPSAADLASYDSVIWFTGYAWQNGVFTPQNETDVGSYLDSGGSFLLSSQEYHYEAGTITPFMQNYLGIQEITDDVTELDPIGNTGNPIGNGLGPYTMVRPDDWAVYWPTGNTQGPYDDYADSIPGAQSPFRYNASGQNNSTNFDAGTFKGIFLAYPFEWIDTVDERAEILGPALEWMCGATTGDLSLIPTSQSGNGVAGSTVPYTITIQNQIGFDDNISLTYSAGWPVDGPASVFVANGDMQNFVVNVDIPADSNCYDTDLATIMAVAASDPAFTDTAYLNSSVIPAGLGSLEGIITDVNKGVGIQNAYINIGIGGSHWKEARTNMDGYYSLPNIEACIYDDPLNTANAFGYFDQYGLIIDVAQGVTTTFDVNLDASWPVLTGDPVSVVVPPDSTQNYKMSLANDGSGDLYFHITEVPSGTYQLPLYLNPTMPTGVDPQVYSNIAVSPDGNSKFIVYMKQQADLSAAYEMDWSARGQYVLDTLRSVANQTQRGLQIDLNKRGVSYESRYIVNALVVKGNLALVDFLASQPEVGFIGPNTAIPAPAPVSVDTTSVSPDSIEWNIEKIAADQVWSNYDVTGQGIVLSNIDTGVQWDHPALINQYRGWDGAVADHNYNWWDPYNQNPTMPTDAAGHGTHTMGTMLGSDDPTVPISATNAIGVAPGAQWLACDGFDNNTGFGYDAELLECAEFLLAPWDLTGGNPDPDMRPDIINNSWGGGQGQWWYNQAIYAWRAAGIMGVFSIGNPGSGCGLAGSPGDAANMLGVGATDISDTIAVFSGRGPAFITGITKPNVTAPGVNIRSSVPGSNYESGWNGTSMAAPHVAGTVALIWSAVPELRGDVQITSWIIEQTAFGLTTNEGCGGDLPDEIPNNTYGWGRINAYDAVSMAMATDWDTPWLDVDPLGGTVAPSAQQDITLSFDTTGLHLGECFVTDLKVEYNDPYVTEEIVPVELCIEYPNIFLPIINK